MQRVLSNSLTLVLFFIINTLSTSCETKSKNETPNIVVLLIDDMGFGDLSCNGNPVIKTPNIDRLSAQSLRFTNFGVSPCCAPTRCAIMTGKSPFKSDVTHTIPGRREMDEESITIAEILKEKGYATGMFGKWHLGLNGNYSPWKRGFDIAINAKDDSQNSHFDPTLIRNGVEEKQKGFRTDILFQEAMNFMEKHKNEKFFCYVPTYSPHAPLKVPEEYSAPYENMENVNANFSGMVANIDKNVGLLMNKLKELGLDENTLVVFMNDNGGTNGVNLYNAGMRGTKGTAWWGGIHSCSYWRWPAKLIPGNRPQLSAHFDLLPTLADIAGATVPKDLKAELDGSSLFPLMEDANTEWDADRMFVHHRGRWDVAENYEDHKYTHAVVRWRNFHLVRVTFCDDPKCKINCGTWKKGGIKGALYSNDPEDYRLTHNGDWELYNIKQDIHQDHNIAAENPEIVKKMEAFYESWWDDVTTKLIYFRAKAK